MPVQFVASAQGLIISPKGCAQVRGGGVLIRVGTPREVAPDTVKVGMSSFVACLGADGVTYTLHHDSRGWTVTEGTIDWVS